MISSNQSSSFDILEIDNLSYKYPLLTCAQVEGFMVVTLIGSAITNAIGAVISLYYVFLHKTATVSRKYTQVPMTDHYSGFVWSTREKSLQSTIGARDWGVFWVDLRSQYHAMNTNGIKKLRLYPDLQKQISNGKISHSQDLGRTSFLYESQLQVFEHEHHRSFTIIHKLLPISSIKVE